MSTSDGDETAGDPGPAALTVTVTDRGPAAAATVDGNLDAATAPLLLDTVGAVLDEGASSVTLDCTRLQFCDSAGLRSLMLIAHRLPDGATVTLAGADEALVRLLRITGTDSLFVVT